MDDEFRFTSFHRPVKSDQGFQNLSQNIGTSIQKISQNVSSMQRMVNQMGTAQDSPDLRTQLHQIQRYTQQVAKDVNQNLKELNQIEKDSGEDRLLKIQRERLTDEFSNILSKFQAIQRLAAQKEKDEIKKNKQNIPITLNKPQVGHFNKNEQIIELKDNRKLQQQIQLEADYDLQALQQQEQSIRQLENDISDVNKIFKDLGTLIHSQGEIIDSIETNVENSHISVSTGTQQLREALNYQNKSRRKKLFCSLIAGVMAVLLLIFIFYNSN